MTASDYAAALRVRVASLTPKEHAADILRRVHEAKALDMADREPLLKLIEGEFMHVNPVHVPGEVCPYRLTDKGRRALGTWLRRQAAGGEGESTQGTAEGPPSPAQPEGGQDDPPWQDAVSVLVEVVDTAAPAASAVAAKAEAIKKPKPAPKGKAKKPKERPALVVPGEIVQCPECAAEVCTVEKPIDGGPIIAPSYFGNWLQPAPSAVQGLPFRCKCGAAWCERKFPVLRVHILGRGWVEGGK